MPLGPGALSLLLQPTHVNNPARGDGVFRAADQLEQQRQNEWYRGQREQEIAEQRRQFDVSHGLEQKKFDYMGQEKRRLEEMSVYDELLEAESSQDPQKMLAALNKARARGVTAPGYEEKINELFKSSGEKGKTAQPGETPTAQPKSQMSVEDQALSKELDTVKSKALEGIRGPFGSDIGQNVGQDIGDGWEVVETPPEATGEAGAPAPMPSAGQLPPAARGSGMNDLVLRGPPGEIQPIPNATGPGRMHDGVLRDPGALLQIATPIGEDGEALQRSPFTGELLPPQGLRPSPGLAGGLSQEPRSGATVVYGSDGRALGTVDPETAMARSRERVQQALSPLMEQARTAEEKRAAAIAMDTGQRLVGTMPVDKIVANAQERYDSELGRDTAKTVARGGKGEATGKVAAGAPPDKTMYERAGRTPEEIRAIKSIGDYVHTKIIQKAQAVHKTAELQRVSGTARQIAAKIDKEGGFAQRQAIRDVLRMTEGARQTDADLNYALRGDGALGQLHLKLNEYIASGKLPHNFRQQLADYATLLDALNDERKERAAAYAREFAMKDPGLRDMVGEEDLGYWAEQAARGAMGEAMVPPPAKAAPDAEADAIMGGD